MVFVDALYINISGGKVLLDYIIEEFNKSEIDVFYLFDSRIKGKHPAVKGDNLEYLDASLLARHRFYSRNSSTFSKVLCFGNLPPSVRLSSPVYTYFHQPLFLEIRKEIPFSQKIKLRIKTYVLSKLVTNTDYWLVQSEFIKNSLMVKFGLNSGLNTVKIVPFFPPLVWGDKQIERKKQLVYISNGESHKNHIRLLEAYTQFYDNTQKYELHLTVERRFESLYRIISDLREKGYPTHAELAQDMVREMDYLPWLKRSCKDEEEATQRENGIGELYESIRSRPVKSESELIDFLGSVCLDDERDTGKDDLEKQQGVTLITLHASKGLEFPHVYLPGLEEGILPHKRSVEEGTRDEERRLLYVGITRARERLTLTWCAARTKWGDRLPSQGSSFIRELDETFVQRASWSELRNRPVSQDEAKNRFSAMRQMLGG